MQSTLWRSQAVTNIWGLASKPLRLTIEPGESMEATQRSRSVKRPERHGLGLLVVEYIHFYDLPQKQDQSALGSAVGEGRLWSVTLELTNTGRSPWHFL